MPADVTKQLNTRPWLSAIMPSHNGDRWLAEALQSVADQNDPGIEIIVVDSSDTDATMDIVARFADRLTIRAKRRPDLGSWMEKTDFGVKIAQADWISMLHKDDLWLPGRAAAVREWIGASPGAAMHLHSAHIIDEAGKRLGLWHCPLPVTGPAPPQQLLERLLVQNFIAVPTPVIRREAYLAVGGMDKTLWYTADWDLYLKLSGTGALHYHDAALACYRIHGSSLTSSGSRSLGDFREQMQTVLERHIGRLATGQERVLRLAKASIETNVALAAVSRGSVAPLFKALARLCALGPLELVRYLRASRLVERAYPRLRARLAGAL